MNKYIHLLVLLMPICLSGCFYRSSSRSIGDIDAFPDRQPIVFDVAVPNRATSWALVWEGNRLSEAEKLIPLVGNIDVYIKNLSRFRVRAFTDKVDSNGRQLFEDISQGEEALLFEGSVTNLIKSSYGINFNSLGPGLPKSEDKKIRVKIIMKPRSSIDLGKNKFKLSLYNSDSI
jgi:hypothetical protein